MSELVPCVRELAPGDESFIFNSWLRSFKISNDHEPCGLPGWAFWKYYHGVIDRLLSGSNVRVLCDKNKPDFILGYLCWDDAPTFTVVHYAYLKRGFRKIGLLRMMVEAAEFDHRRVVYTFSCHIARELVKAKCEEGEFLPIDKWLER